MADRSAIEWTDASWNCIRARNLVTGKLGWHCEHATTGCEFCYAEGFNKRLGTGLPFKPGHRKDIEILCDDVMLTQPLRWKKPRKIFVCSMTDLFADFVTDEWIDKMFAVMALAPQHTFQVLSKRAARMRDYFADPLQHNRVELAAEAIRPSVGAPFSPKHVLPRILPNVWLGVSTERQQEADERIPLLLQTPAAVRFISAEPLLGPISLRWAKWDDWKGRTDIDHLDGARMLDWVIVGGESGPKARPMHPDWVRELRDQCGEAGIAFFLKQWGEWAPGECAQKAPTRTERTATWFADEWMYGALTPRASEETHYDDAPDVYRLGKKAAGRLLDGVEHNEFPTPRPQ